MPKNRSRELRERLEQQKGDDLPPLPVNFFVSIHWPLDGDGERSAHRCYSTFGVPVTMDGNRYTGKDVLLDFDEQTDTGFMLSSDHLIYGASCGFRVFDSEGLASRIVGIANERHDFPPIHFDAWMHFSDDVAEIESLIYGENIFSGFATRIELQKDIRYRPIAKVWGGHEGISASKTSSNIGVATSALGRPIPLGEGISRLLSRA